MMAPIFRYDIVSCLGAAVKPYNIRNGKATGECINECPFTLVSITHAAYNDMFQMRVLPPFLFISPSFSGREDDEIRVMLRLRESPSSAFLVSESLEAVCP
jgi:hypothetical protein